MLTHSTCDSYKGHQPGASYERLACFSLPCITSCPPLFSHLPQKAEDMLACVLAIVLNSQIELTIMPSAGRSQAVSAKDLEEEKCNSSIQAGLQDHSRRAQ